MNNNEWGRAYLYPQPLVGQAEDENIQLITEILTTNDAGINSFLNVIVFGWVSNSIPRRWFGLV